MRIGPNKLWSGGRLVVRSRDILGNTRQDENVMLRLRLSIPKGGYALSPGTGETLRCAQSDRRRHFYHRALAVLVSLALLVIAAGPPMSRPAHAQGASLDALLKTEGEKRQVIQFNPGAALQKRIFADGFVPNSGEFGLDVEGVTYAAQRAESLANGRVRVYYVAVGDWGNVRFVERDSVGGKALGERLLQEGESRQVIQFNPAAALQGRIFKDGFVPNSPEFGLTANGVSYAAQRAENLGSGDVRVYHVVVGEWGNVLVTGQGGGGASGAPASTLQPLQITFIESRRDLEYIEIRNAGTLDQPMDGWRIYSTNGESSTGCGTRREDQSYTFPSDFVLRAGQRVRVHSGRFAAPVPNTATTLYWAQLYIWYNDGDRGELVAPTGSVVSTRSYGWCR